MTQQSLESVVAALAAMERDGKPRFPMLREPCRRIHMKTILRYDGAPNGIGNTDCGGANCPGYIPRTDLGSLLDAALNLEGMDARVTFRLGGCELKLWAKPAIVWFHRDPTTALALALAQAAVAAIEAQAKEVGR